MALRKILGIETEYGILVRGAAESNPIAASSVPIGRALAGMCTLTVWPLDLIRYTGSDAPEV